MLTPQCIGSTLHWFHGMLTPQCIGSTLHWFHGILMPQCIGSTLHWFHGMMTLQCIGSTLHWFHGMMTLQCIGSTLHWFHGMMTLHVIFMEEWCYTYWAIQAGLLTPLTFAWHHLSPLATFTSGAYFLHTGLRWQWICEFYTANFKGIFWGP